jgi:hypothetical protein
VIAAASIALLVAGFVWLGAFALHDGFRAWMKRQTWRSLRDALIGK